MRKALVVGGANGIGLSIATLLAADSRFEKVYIVDRANVAEEFVHPKFECHNFDLCSLKVGLQILYPIRGFIKLHVM